MASDMIGRATSAATTSGGKILLSIARRWRRARCLAARLIRDRSGIAATEFSVIAPLMLVLFFGVVEVTSGFSAYRKVSITAHAISDLTAQAQSVQDSDLTNFFCDAAKIMYPYVPSSTCPPVPSTVKQSIAELWIDNNLQARLQWEKNSDGSAPPPAGTIVNVPPDLLAPANGTLPKNTYVIYSSVSYVYVPAIGFVLNKLGVNLSDFAYTRPRQSQCVLYNATTGSCPQN